MHVSSILPHYEILKILIKSYYRITWKVAPKYDFKFTRNGCIKVLNMNLPLNQFKIKKYSMR